MVPFAVTVTVPVGAAPMLAVCTVTARVTVATEGIELLDATPLTLVAACTTVKGTATLVFAS